MTSVPSPRVRLTLPVLALLQSVILAGAATAQAHDSKLYSPIDWPSKPPADCPFEPSEDLVGVTFTGRHREYTNADCWYPSWASDGNLYSPFSDGFVENVLPDGTRARVSTLGAKGAESNAGYGKIVGDDPMDLQVIGLGALPTPAGHYDARYPSGSLVHDGVWYYGSHPEGAAGHLLHGEKPLPWAWVGSFVGFRISKDYGRTWSDEPNDPAKPLFDEMPLDAEGKPKGGPIRIGEPFFVDFGKNMEHSPDGKAYLVAHGASAPRADPRQVVSSWCIGDEAFLLRVVPSPKTINDASQYEFFAGHDEKGEPVWTRERAKMKPLLSWKDRVGAAVMTYNAPLKRYLFLATDGRAATGPYHTYILESERITGPWKLVVYMENFGEQGYFVNLPSKFINEDGRTAWLCYAANYSAGNPGSTLKPNPPGSRYAMNLQEIRLRAKEQERMPDERRDEKKP